MRIAGRVVLVALVLGVLGGFGWYAWWGRGSDARGDARPASASAGRSTSSSTVKPLFRCDTRNQCEQMTSCEEAMFFLKNCPNTAPLDQDKDGIPCEVQWCQK